MANKETLNPVEADMAGGVPAYSTSFGKSAALNLSAYGLVLFFLAAGLFSALVGSLESTAKSSGWLQPLLYVVVFLCTLIAHELVHGLFFRLFGGSPKYGAGMQYFIPYLYATSPKAFSVGRFIVIALAPLVVLSTLSLGVALLVPAWVGYLAVVFTANASGAIGDLWITSRLLRFCPLRDVTVIDQRFGIAVYTNDPRAGEIAQRFAARDARSTGVLIYWIGATLVLFFVGSVAGPIIAQFTDNLTIGPPWLPLLQVSTSTQEQVFTLNLASPVVGGLIFAVLARVLSRRKT